MVGIFLAASLLVATLSGMTPVSANRCLSDSACKDSEYCLKAYKPDDWGTCFPRAFGKPQCSSDSDCPSGKHCERKSMNDKWQCVKKR